MGRIYKDATGVEIIIDLKEDLSAFTSMIIYARKPDKTIVEWVPSIYESTKMRYVTQLGDLDLVGDYTLQPYAAGDPWSGRGLSCCLKVYPNFE